MATQQETGSKGSNQLTRINKRLEKEKELAPTRQSFIYGAKEFYQTSILSTDEDLKNDEIKFQELQSANKKDEEEARRIRLKVKSDQEQKDKKQTSEGQDNKQSPAIKPILVSHQKTPEEVSQKPRVSFAQMDEIGQHSTASKPAAPKKQVQKPVEQEEEPPKRTSLFKQRMMNSGGN